LVVAGAVNLFAGQKPAPVAEDSLI